MDYFIQYGLFLAKVMTITLAIVFVLLTVAAAGSRHKRGLARGHVKVSKLNDHFEEMQQSLQRAVLDKDAFKREQKDRKQREKDIARSRKQAAGGEGDDERRKRVYVLNFKGDIAAHAVTSLREEISAVLSMATGSDEILLRLESPGGMVHAYGLASSQLMRIKQKNIPLTICVDKVAASGGYMMACLADRLVAAPFAIIGSIGVLVQLPNFHRVLKKNDIDYETISAGEFKTTLTTFGEVTQKGREKVKEDVEELHALFKKWVKDHRPAVDIDRIATGETWVGVQAKERYMVDDLKTSDECLVSACSDADVYEVEFEHRKTIQDRFGLIFRGAAQGAVETLLENGQSRNFYS